MNIRIDSNKVYINGEEVPSCPAEGNNVAIINDKIYINGYEYKSGKWKKTFLA